MDDMDAKIGKWVLNFGWAPLLIAFSIGIFLNTGKTNKAHAAKPDACRQYHEKAVRIAEGKVFNFTNEGAALISIAYTFIYQNCRDLERQNP